jgi:hypothetical protein
MDPLKEQYDSQLADARRLLATDDRLLALIDPALDSTVMERFLIQYSSLAVQMTEPVEGWIRRAGERTIQVGLPDIGARLIKHAAHEANHHLMLIRDTEILVEHWNQHHSEQLDARQLLARAPTRPMREYIALHEDTIASDEPFGQVAIELEIEGISVSYAPHLVAACKRALGPAVNDGLSFLHDHVTLDVGHTQFNNRLMSDLLAARPAVVDRLARIGIRALEIYIAFFGECLEAARQIVGLGPMPAQQAAGRPQRHDSN